ncbi:iron permease [Exidia glandulosa HHB12029]|uniref:Iron permease n=1 Tax=Exidia glandulosa HHB12029 TaxID=1314781 RepID=A0A165DBK2_EXIGL|nr:iron permease [Exidia glandulosa HHB12029]
MSEDHELPLNPPLVDEERGAASRRVKPKRGKAFWLLFLSLAVSLYQAAFELCAVAVALPSIANDLDAVDFVWAGAAYAIAASCSLPMTGSLAQTFGRRAATLTSLVIFAVGSVICGAAVNMNMLIAGRVVQGWGGGGILAMPHIILSDLVSLRERGTYNGILAVTWSVAIVSSSAIAGALSDAGQWRWIFYLNLLITAVAIVLVLKYLRMAVPQGNVIDKLKRLIRLAATIIIIGSTCCCCIALTWAGVRFAWDSAQVLGPLCVGIAGLITFVIYELRVPKMPLIPFHLLTNKTCVVGYLTTFLNGLITMASVYYFPVYLQACKGQSAAHAGGVGWLGFVVTVGPWGIIAGVSIAVLKRYVPTILFGWTCILIGMGLFTTLKVDTPASRVSGFEAIFALGIGTLYTTTFFPVLAPLPVSANAPALAFFNFLRAFAQVWGVTIGASVLQNQLLSKLPPDFVATLPKGIQVAYTAIPKIGQLEEPLRSEVREAFAESLRIVWIVILAIAAFGTACMVFMREIPMHNYTDDDWALVEGSEKAAPASRPQAVELRSAETIAKPGAESFRTD